MKVRAHAAPIVSAVKKQQSIARLLAPMTRYTKLVIFGRNFLWFLIAAVIGAVVWQASDNTSSEGSRLVFSSITKNEDLQNVMHKPHYQGLDSNNNPYTVIADKATQKDKDTVVLERIRADMVQADGTWVALNSGSGEMNLESRKMVLSDGVSVFYEGGYEFETTQAQVDIDKGEAYGDAPVAGQGPVGTLTADKFEIRNRGKVIRFNGSVKMKLYN